MATATTWTDPSGTERTAGDLLARHEGSLPGFGGYVASLIHYPAVPEIGSRERWTVELYSLASGRTAERAAAGEEAAWAAWTQATGQARTN